MAVATLDPFVPDATPAASNPVATLTASTPSFTDALTAPPVEQSTTTPPSFTSILAGPRPQPAEQSGTRFERNLPRSAKAYARKYERNAEFLSTLPEPIVASLKEFDRKRALRGQSPLSSKETARVLKSAIAKQAATPEPERDATNVHGNAIADLRAIVSSIPRLPVALVKEVLAVPRFAQEYQANIAEGDNPITALAQSPGIRMLPGAYTVGNVAAGPEGWNEAATHPLMTFLDVLPGINKAAAATKVGKIAKAEGINPIRANLTRTALPEGAVGINPATGRSTALAPNRLGQLTEAAASSRAGTAVREAFSPASRDISRVRAKYTNKLREAIDPDSPIPDLGDGLDPIANLAREARGLGSKHNLNVDEVEILTKIGTERPDLIPDLPDAQKAYLSDAKRISQQYGEWLSDQDLVTKVNGEFYDHATGRRILKAHERYAKSVAPIRDKWLPKLREMVKVGDQDPRLADLVAMLEDPATPMSAVNKAYNNLMRSKTSIGARGNVGPKPGPSAVASGFDVTNLRRDIRAATAAEKLLARVDKKAPARFDDLILNRANEQTITRITAGKTPEEAAQIADMVVRRQYNAIPGFDVGEVEKILGGYVDDVSATWRELRAAGEDPIFLHRAPVNAEAAVAFPRAWESARPLSQVKQRAAPQYQAPHVKNLDVALSHQGMEILSTRIAQSMADEISTTFGRTEAELLTRYMPQAEQLARRRPGIDPLAHAERLLKRDFTPYEPANGINFTKGKLTGRNPERVWLPKTMAQNLERAMPNPASFNAVWDPALSVFRTSVLPLSPRWHLYNIVGGAVSTLMQLPGKAHSGEAIRQAWKIARGTADDVDEALRLELGSMSREQAAFNYMSGKTMGRMLDEASQGQGAKAGLASAAQTAGGVGRKVIEKSYQFNQLFDDFYRSYSYLTGKKQASATALKKGKNLSDDAAQEAGLHLARKVLQTMDDLTPIERQIVRSIFPFYTFMSHVMRQTLKYPFDHPMRASIMASFARNELADHASGLPDEWLQTFTLGDPDEKGNVWSVSVGGMNPFRDTADLFTVAGFVSNVNPAIATVMQSLGFDTMTGGADLYPDLHYDPSTGRLTADTGNPLTNLVQNTIPQSRIFTALTGINGEYRKLYQDNPDAANRMLASNLGLPVPVRQINLPEQYFRSELRRMEAYEKQQSKALDTMSDTNYPEINALVEQVRKLEANGDPRVSPYLAPSTDPPLTDFLTGPLNAVTARR
jgi:hypothetical protein